MQFFDRRPVPPPRAFQTPDFDAARQRLATFWERGPERMAQSDFEDLRLPLNDASILDGIRAVFHDKCAFCETLGTVHPYRFRPSRSAYPAASGRFPHLYYAWLAHAWENVYALCADCTPTDEDYFPVEDERCPLPTLEDVQRFAESRQGAWGLYPPKERPLLLDPCVDLPFSLLFAVTFDGRIHSQKLSAQTTIDYFSLDRPQLRERRRIRFRQYLIDILSAPLNSDFEKHPTFDFERLEFGGAWHLLLRRPVETFRRRLSTSRGGIAKSIRTLLRNPETRPLFEAYFEMGSTLRQPLPPIDTPVFHPLPERRPAPQLRQIEIDNFKSIAKLSLSLPEPVSAADKANPRLPALLLLGENATGKSSILEAITLACLSVNGIKDLGLKREHLILKPERLGGGAEEKVRQARVELRFAEAVPRILEVTSGGVTAPADEVPVFAYGAFRRYENQDGRGEFPRARHQASLFHSRSTLPNPTAWLVRLHDLENDRFLMVARVLNKLFGVEDDSFRMIRVRDGVCFIAAAEDATATALAETPLEEASSGFRSILGMVCDVCAGLMDPGLNPAFDQLDNAAAIVLIDEIEAHLHPRWKMRVMRGLRDALTQVTFIVSSHEPLCLRGMDSGEVQVLYRTTEGAKGDLPISVRAAEALPDFQRMTIEQILTSDFFSLFTTDAIEAERGFARMADLMARRHSVKAPLTEGERSALDAFENEIAMALPVGASHAQRLVQAAVVKNLAARRKTDPEKRVELDEVTIARIQEILGDI